MIAILTVASAATGVLVVGRLWRPDLEAGGLRSAIETAITLSALFGVLLLRPDLRRPRRLRELMLIMALAAVAVTDFVCDVVPSFASDPDGSYGDGAHLACLLLFTAALIAAAYANPARLIVRGRRPGLIAALAGIAIIGLGEAINLLVSHDGWQNSPGAPEPLMMTFALVVFTGLLVAGYGFVTRAGPSDYEAWLLAGATCLLAVAVLQTLALPNVPADWVTPREPLRILAFGLLFATAVRNYGRTRERVGHEVACAERVRIAEDLHDGLAQDLAYIVAYADRRERDSAEDRSLLIAAQRALAASRGAIVDLEASGSATTAAALGEVAAELEGRYGIEVTVRAPAADDPEPSIGDRRELLRIAREAIVNAARHGAARHVVVTLGSRQTMVLLRITDDGRGLGARASRAPISGGRGLRMMRDRARTLGAHLVVRSRDGSGTEISVVTTRAGVNGHSR